MRKYEKFWMPGLLVLAVACLYGPFLSNPLVFDDIPFFTPDKYGKLPFANMLWSPFQLRSLPYATLTWTYAHFGQDLVYLRLGNLLLHGMTVLALYFFLFRLFSAVLGGDGGCWRLCAFGAALLFALHPVAVYAAGYLAERTIVMATLFALLACRAWLEGLQRRRGWLLWLGVFLYYCAVYSKEHAVMLPAVMVALTVLVREDWLDALKKSKWPVLGLVVIALSVFMVKFGLIGSVYEPATREILDKPQQQDNLYLLSVLTQAWLFFKYAFLWFIPNPAWMSIDMREPFAGSVFSVYLLAGLAFLAYGMAAMVLLFRRGMMGLLGFALLFPWFMFMTEFSVARLQEVFVLYRSYLWAAGAFAILPVLVARLDKKLLLPVLGLCAIGLFAISMERLATFSHPVLLWDDAEELVRDHPERFGAYRIYYNRGTEWAKVDRFDLALADLKRSIELLPEQPAAYQNLGFVYLKMQDWPKAIAAFSMVLKQMQQQGVPLIDARPYYGRAMAYEGAGDMAHARKDYRLSCRYGRRGCDKIALDKLQ